MVDFQNITVVALAAPQGLEDGFPEHSIFGRDWAQKENPGSQPNFFFVFIADLARPPVPAASGLSELCAAPGLITYVGACACGSLTSIPFDLPPDALLLAPPPALATQRTTSSGC